MQTKINAVPPDLEEIAAGWEEIAGLADYLKEEENKEEEEEQSQSAEDKKASETAKSQVQSSITTPKTTSTYSATISRRISSTSASSASSSRVSSLPARYYSGLIQAYPVDYYDSQAADDAAFALAGALFSAMGGSDGGTAEMPSTRTSSNGSVSAIGRITKSISSSTNLPSQTTDGYRLSGVRNSESVRKNGVTTSAENATTSTNGLSTTATSPSAAGSSAPIFPIQGKPGITSSGSTQITNLARTSTSQIRHQPASVSEASSSSISASSISAVSTLTVSALAASVSAASVSAASASRASSVSTASAFASASASSASVAAVSFPSQISSNTKGSSLCKSISKSTCINAYSNYNPLFLYNQYTSYVYTPDGFDGEWLGWGCAAMLKCDANEAYTKGILGQYILNGFAYLFEKDGVGVCGSLYMDNGCYLTVNACDECESSIPCEALPEQYQPPGGNVPCYYKDGTTWPPISKLPPPCLWGC